MAEKPGCMEGMCTVYAEVWSTGSARGTWDLAPGTWLLAPVTWQKYSVLGWKESKESKESA